MQNDAEIRSAIRSRDVSRATFLIRAGMVEEALDIMLDAPDLAPTVLSKAREAVSVLIARGDAARAARFKALADRAQVEVNFWAGKG